MTQDNKNAANPNTGADGKNSKEGTDRPASQTDARNGKPAEKGSAGHSSDSPTGSHPHGEKKTTP